MRRETNGSVAQRAANALSSFCGLFKGTDCSNSTSEPLKTNSEGQP